jgi:hypothetical protein
MRNPSSIMTAGIATGIHVHNLDQLNVGTALVGAVVVIALAAMGRAAHRLRATEQTAAPDRSPPTQTPDHSPPTQTPDHSPPTQTPDHSPPPGAPASPHRHPAAPAHRSRG